MELSYLKTKVDAGADLITTQMFFDAPVFLTFVRACREIGITVPIVPGIMMIQVLHVQACVLVLLKPRCSAELRWLPPHDDHVQDPCRSRDCCPSRDHQGSAQPTLCA